MSEASKAKRKKAGCDMQANNALAVEQAPDETGAQAVARKVLDPGFRHALTASQFADKMLGTSIEHPGLMDYVDHVLKVAGEAKNGDLAIASKLLAAQALTLDSMFTELARRSALNMSEYLGATESYGRLALKAQSNCRATLEALAKLHQPREQTVRHVHVNEGGQAVIADQFHNHGGGSKNAESDNQSHGAATGPAGIGAALPSPDPLGNGVPIPSRERAETVPNARRHKSGRA